MERTPEQHRHHYDVERELAAKLRRASASERRELYGQVYDELFRRVPDHPQIARKGKDEQRQRVAWAMALLDKFLRPDMTFLEVGAGDCSLSFAVAAKVKRVCAVDVSALVTESAETP